MTQPQLGDRIVVGLDRTGAHDGAVLAAALDQACLTKAAVSLVHAIAPGRSAVRDGPADHRAAAADLHRLLATLTSDRDAPVTVEYHVRRGDPATVLLMAAQHATLIVVGTRGAPGGSPFLLGTVSQDVAVHAECPVLLVPIR